ncbi:MAG: TOBE domain-containing protein [Bacteroidota bacterium]|jgi:molybdate transport system regulatory protein|nr:TOBE domain-containing protein [Bacteroidota bacterium]
MNTLKGEIRSIKVNGNLSLVTINVSDIVFKTIVIETPGTASYLKTGNNINVIFKETEVVIGKGLEHFVSLQNKLSGNILQIENGKLLSKLTIETPVGNIVAIITLDAVLQMQLQEGETITAMIKTNEIMLSE